MKFVKYLGFFLIVFFLLFVIFILFSAVKSRFQCPGQYSLNRGGTRSTTLYIKLHQYRWWVRLYLYCVWSNSNGSLWIEIPNEYVYVYIVNYFANIDKAGDQLQIFDYDNKFKGNFSTLTQHARYKFTCGIF